MAFEPLSEMAKGFKFGRYAHFKGGEYEAFAIARHSESGEEMVVYREDYGDRVLSVRPLAMFLDDVERGEYRGPRFRYIGPSDTQR